MSGKPAFDAGNNAHLIRVFDIILELAYKGEASWKNIKASVEKSYDVGNWLNVRSVLQVMKDERIVCRTSNVEVEEYVRGPHM